MKIELLVSTLGNSPNEYVDIVVQDEECLYYYDGFHRLCYVFKSEEGESFRRVEEDE